MLIIGCEFHPSFQQVAIFDNRTGEIQKKRLLHRDEAEQFYRSRAGQPVPVGMEACGHYPWFERVLAELGYELWLGDAAEIRATVVRKQKTDRRAGASAGSVAAGSVSADLGAESGRAGYAAVAGASAQAGASADASEEPVAGHGLEPGSAEEAEAVDRSGAAGVGEAGIAALRGRTAEATAAGAGRIGSRDRATEPADGSGSSDAAGGGEVADASGSEGATSD